MSDSTVPQSTPPRGAELQPWQQQPGESLAAYRSFLLYRDVGEARSLIAVARELGKCPSLIYRRARRCQWRDRAYAWDRAQAQEDEEAAALRRRRLQQRSERDAEWFRVGALAAIRHILRQDPTTGEWSVTRALKPREIRVLYEMYEELTGAPAARAAAADRPKPSLRSCAEADRDVAEYLSVFERLLSESEAGAEEAVP